MIEFRSPWKAPQSINKNHQEELPGVQFWGVGFRDLGFRAQEKLLGVRFWGFGFGDLACFSEGLRF